MSRIGDACRRMMRAGSLTIVLVAAALLHTASGQVATTLDEQEHPQAGLIARIESLGGQVGIDGGAAGSPVWKVDLSNTQVTRRDLSVLKDLQKLEELHLNGTQITDADLGVIGRLTQLRFLSLDRTRITNAGLKHLRSMKNLQSLSLSDTQITQAGLNVLNDLPRLDLEDILISDETSTSTRSDRPVDKVSESPDSMTVESLDDDNVFVSLDDARRSEQLFELGSALFLSARSGSPEALRAIRLLEQAMELNPLSDDYRLNLADAYVRNGHELGIANALDQYDYLLQGRPGDVRILTRMAEAYSLLENHEDALDYAVRALEASREKQIYPAALQVTTAAIAAGQIHEGVRRLQSKLDAWTLLDHSLEVDRLAVQLLNATLLLSGGRKAEALGAIDHVLLNTPAKSRLAIEANKLRKKVQQ